MYKAIIEMPRGDDRRRHWNKEQRKFVDLGSLKNAIPVNNGIMPVDYGFLENTFCSGDDEEIDVLLISEKNLLVGDETVVQPIGMLVRADKDHKIVAVDETTQETIKKWEDIGEELRKKIIDSFSYHFAIEKIEDIREALKYINENKT